MAATEVPYRRLMAQRVSPLAMVCVRFGGAGLGAGFEEELEEDPLLREV